jgi:GT2 family glycosyltransferase
VCKSTVVVVTWRGRELVGGCLAALAAQTAPHTVLVVDNASDDGTAAVLATLTGGGPVCAAAGTDTVGGARSAARSAAGSAEDQAGRPPRVLRLPRNRGYAGGLAAALPFVRTPYVAWLNDDAEPQPHWLASLEAVLDAAPEVAAAGSMLLSWDGSVQSAGVQLTPLGYGRDTADTAGPHGDGVFGFCGGAALLRTDALRAVGGVPARFFCYYEDTDTAWRLRLAGYDVRAVAGAAVQHRHGASSRLGSAAFHRWNERNRLLMLLRCAPAAVAARELARFAAITAVLPLRRLLRRLLRRPLRRHQHGLDRLAPNHRVALRLRVLATVVARLPAALRQRAAIGRRTTVARAKVWHRWAGQ